MGSRYYSMASWELRRTSLIHLRDTPYDLGPFVESDDIRGSYTCVPAITHSRFLYGCVRPLQGLGVHGGRLATLIECLLYNHRYKPSTLHLSCHRLYPPLKFRIH